MPICRSARRVSGALLTAFLILPVLAGCGGGSAGTSPLPAGEAAPSLGDALTELDAQQAPAGTDPAVFETLRAELRRQLEQKQGSQLEKAPPTADRSRTELSWDEDSATLSWRYCSSGDYDQNGEVSVSDLTPLGVHFGKEAAEQSQSVIDQLAGGPGAPPFGLTAIEGVVDGDQNGQIGISDITPIGQNFYASVSAYWVYAGSEAEDYPAANGAASTLIPLAEIALSEAQGTPAAECLTFSYTVPSPEEGMSYWVRPVFGGQEGTPSEVAGAGLNYAPGSLALTGISPASAEPGQLIWLQFNQELAGQLEGLSLVVNGETDVEVEIGDLAVRDNAAGTAAPMLAPGPVHFEVFQDGVSVGSTELTLLVPDTDLTPASAEQQFDESAAVLDSAFTDYFELLNGSSAEFDSAAAQLELADFNAAISGVVEYFFDELALLSPEDQTAVLCYLENSGYFELLDALGRVSAGTSRTTSIINMRNWEMLALDMFSAAATNNAIVMDLVGLGITVLTSGGTFPALIAAKTILTIFDNAVDTFIPTDLFDLRVISQTRNLASGEGYHLKVEGQFAAEKPSAGGTIELFVEAAMAGIKLPAGFKDAVLEQVISDLNKKIAGKLIQEFWKLILPVVDNPDSPCDGHIGGDWMIIDLHLYTTVDWEQLKQRLLYNDFSDWLEGYPEDPEAPAEVIKFEPSGYAEAGAGFSQDRIEFSHPEKYIVTVSAFSFSDTQSFLLLWSHTGIKEIVLEVPYWVGRFGDWKNVTISGEEYSVTGGESLACVANGKPVCIYYVNSPYCGWNQTYALDAQGDNWSAPVKLLEDATVVDLTVINGLPAIMYKDSYYNWRMLIANDAGGTDWPDSGVTVGATVLCSGTHSGPASDSTLVDSSAMFVSSGIEPGHWVELFETGNIERVSSVISETELKTTALPAGAMYSAGVAYEVSRNPVVTNRQCRLGVVDGKPAVVFNYIGGSQPEDTYYSSAKNWLGTDWNEPVLIGQECGILSELKTIEGAPAYCAARNSVGIYFRRAADATGQVWPVSHQIVDADGNPWLHRLEEISGSPAILYEIEVELPDNPEIFSVDELYFKLATSSDGSHWDSPILVARGSEESVSASGLGDADLAEINGLPAIAFQGPHYDFCYLEALDTYGGTWQEVVEIDQDGSLIRLFELGAGPAACYYNSLEGMRFSRPEL